MSDPQHASILPPVLIVCAAAVIAVPLFRRLRLGAVIGYLAAGVVLGPHVLAVFADPVAVSRIADIGVVLLLFIVGLDMDVKRLVSMRADILGLGAGQVVVTATLLGGGAWALGLSPAAAWVVGFALSLSATAIALQLLEERGDLGASYGKRTFAVLLFQDISVAPVLAAVPLIAGAAGVGAGLVSLDSLRALGLTVAALCAMIVAGLYLLTPLFRLLAKTGAREVMTAAALLVVLGSALAMEAAGLSMALGAFLAGILLSESAFKHQVEADIEPFRGLLLGLFFMSVGMGIDLPAVIRDLAPLVAATVAIFAVKVGCSWVLFRLSRTGPADALRGAILLAPAGEFAFVLLPMIAAMGLAPRPLMQSAVAVGAMSMAMGPLVAGLAEWLMARRQAPESDTSGVETATQADARGAVLVIGFGRFGQVVNQVLLAEGVDVTVIDRNVDAIRSAARFGFRIYYGDGSRLDVLRAAGAEEARVICVCVDDARTATRILDLARDSFPQARVVVRAHDRVHALDLLEKGADAQVRETLHSAMVLGRIALEEMGVDPDRAAEIEADVRRRDAVRLALQQHEGLMGGSHLLHGAEVRPEPLLKPKSRAAGLTPETRALIARDQDS